MTKYVREEKIYVNGKTFFLWEMHPDDIPDLNLDGAIPVYINESDTAEQVRVKVQEAIDRETKPIP